MLRYLNSGVRRFGNRPVWSYRRANWEFYAVLRGQCGVLLEPKPMEPLPLEDCRKLPLKQSSLWIFPPQQDHGWYGKPDASCQVAVFHFNRVPEVLEDAMQGRDFLEQALTKEDTRRIWEMARTMEPEYQKPTVLGNLRAERTLIDLTLILLADSPVTALSNREQMEAQKVDAAMAWFTKHMAVQPSLEDIATAVHVSPTQLRRLFAKVREESPYHALNGIRLETAAKLLASTDDKLEAIASECGFSSASNFCRSFKDYLGCSPSRWRRRSKGYDQQMRDWVGLSKD